MDNANWIHLKSKYKLGQFVLGKVDFHAPFGVFVNLDDPVVKGLIKIPDFLDEGVMQAEMYPAIGTTVGAVVVGYNESNQQEVYLSARPSVLHRSLVPLNLPAVLAG
jgi:ribosomal protein S1